MKKMLNLKINSEFIDLDVTIPERGSVKFLKLQKRIHRLAVAAKMGMLVDEYKKGGFTPKEMEFFQNHPLNVVIQTL